MAVQFINMHRVDLEKGPAIVQLNRMFFADKAANRIGAYLFQNGAAVSPGGSCSGTAVLSTGATVAITGTVSGNEVYIDLPSGVYSAFGPVQVYVTWTNGTISTTVVAGFGNVARTQTGTVIDPGAIIPSVSALIAEIQSAVASIPADYSALLATIAPTYSTSATYTAGQYVWYSGTLYRAKVDIAAAESWTAARWQAAVIGNDLTGKAGKRDFDQLKSGFNSTLCPVAWEPAITEGSYIATASGKATNSSSGKYSRTTAIWDGHGAKAAIACANPNYNYSIAYYDATGDITDGTGYLGYSGYASGVQYIPETAAKICLSFRRTDEAAMDSTDTAAIRAALSAYAATDKSLSTIGIAADAKTTGDRLHAIEDSTAYGGATEKTISLNGGIVYGNFGVNTGMSYTSAAYRRSANPIPIPEGAVSVTVKTTGSYDVWIGKFSATPSFANETSNSSIYLGGIGKSTSSVSFTPESGTLYYLSYSSDSSASSLIPKITWDNALDAAFKELSNSIPQLNTRVSDIEDSAAYGGTAEKRIRLNGGIVYGNFGLNSGKSYTSAAYRRSANPIPIPDGSVAVTVKTTGDYEVWVGKFSATPSFENETSNSAIYLGGIGKSTDYVTFAPEEGVLYYLSYSSDNSASSLIPKITWDNALDRKIKQLSTAPSAAMSMFTSIGVCGASWESGYIYPSGQSSPIEKSELSWGANVARRNGIPTYGCYAYHGVYTKTWLENASCLPALLAADPHQLYVINLLGNDSTYGTAYLGSIADITDYDSYEDYADSYYGNFGRIIEQIEAHAPNALIILIGGEWSATSANRRAYLAAMQEIAAHYNLPTISWNDDPWYGIYNPDFAQGISVSHPTAPLLAGMALCFERLFAKCYLQYPDYFNKYQG